MREEENMKQRWMQIDRFAVKRGDPVKANATCDIEASPIRSKDEVQQAIMQQKALATLSPEELMR
eukprot:11427682-Karenia_brevis.AAC.1